MKYASAILIALSLVVTGWSLVAITHHASRPVAMPTQTAKDPEIEKMAGEEKDIRMTTAALQGLGSILAPNRPAAAVIAYNPAASQTKGNDGASGHQLTLLYYGKNYRRAVIDGQLVAPGDRLPEGARIVAVRDNQVVIRDQTGRQSLTMPTDKIRIGTVAHPPEQK